MAIFNSYVKLPEGIHPQRLFFRSFALHGVNHDSRILFLSQPLNKIPEIHQTSAPRHVNNAPKIAPKLPLKIFASTNTSPKIHEHHKAMRMAQWSCWTPLPMVQRISPGYLGGMVQLQTKKGASWSPKKTSISIHPTSVFLALWVIFSKTLGSICQIRRGKLPSEINFQRGVV